MKLQFSLWNICEQETAKHQPIPSLERACFPNATHFDPLPQFLLESSSSMAAL